MKKSRQICGRKTTVEPTAPTTPSASRSRSGPSGMAPRTSPPSRSKMVSIQPIGYWATRKMA